MALIAEALSYELERRPFLLRSGLELLRRRAPVWSMKKTCLVLGADRVREVFERSADFVNGPIYAPKLKLGPLVLGMDVSTRYQGERQALENAVAHTVQQFDNLVQHHALQIFYSLTPTHGRLDLVAQVIEPVLVRSMCGVFGVKLEAAESKYLSTQSGVATMTHWLRKLGGIIAAGVPAPFGLHALTEHLAGEMHGYLLAQVGTAPAGSVMAALRGRPGFPRDEDVVRSVGGMMLAGATLFKATSLAVHELLQRAARRPSLLAVLESGDIPKIRSLVWEALRFQPPFPFLVRYCPRTTALGDTVVDGGSRVIVSPLSAMFDPTRVDNPDEFAAPRPPTTYMLFGHGQHRCLAENLAERGIPELVAAIFANVTFEQPGKVKIAYDGTAVAKYPVAVTMRKLRRDTLSTDVRAPVSSNPDSGGPNFRHDSGKEEAASREFAD